MRSAALPRRVRLIVLTALGIASGGTSAAAFDPGHGSESTQPYSAPSSFQTGMGTRDQDIASGCWRIDDRQVNQGIAFGAASMLIEQWRRPPQMIIDLSKTYTATVKTNNGIFEVDLFPKDAPIAVNNFVCLAKAGYYDNTPFHRIVAGFVIQGGDPTGTGRGGPGYQFQDEKVTKDYTKGTVAMANAGPNTNGSQFFVCLQNVNLPKTSTIFGRVSSGMDVVEKLGQSPTKVGPTGEKSVPVKPVIIEAVIISSSG